VRNETPEIWLKELFEFAFCEECGGDSEDHEVCIVPFIGNYFARCLRVNQADADDTYRDDVTPPVGCGVHPSENCHDRLDRRRFLLRLS
jgi:hypothetical protein